MAASSGVGAAADRGDSECILEPLSLPESPCGVAAVEESPSVPCIFCEEYFPQAEQDQLLKHMIIEHKLVIADVKLVADFRRYILYWKKRFTEQPITDFCSVIRTNSEAPVEEQDNYFLLCDVLPEDRLLREQLQQKRLETHTDPAAEDRWRLEWGNGVYFSHFATWQAGVATLFSPNLRPEVLGDTEAVLGHLLHLRVRMEGLVVNLVNIYAPQMSSRRPQFYQRVSDFLGTLDSHVCLVLGRDFNTTLEERDRSGAEPSPAAANILRGIVEHRSLVDVCHDHHPDDTSTFTFVRVEAHRSHHSRFDRIYLSRFHLSQAHSSAIRPAPFSDHHLVTITVSLCAERPGPAYWHFNNSLLEDESFVMSFREFWLAWREQWRAFPSVRRWWDLGKVRAKLFCRDYTRGTSRRRNAAIEQLEREVLEVERRLAANPEDPSLCGACQEKREELRVLEDHQARGAFVRSRIRLLWEMDRGSRFFYALEKTRGAKKHITCLLAEDGTPLTDPEEMCGRARDFYTSLFSPDPTDSGACGVLWEELPTVSVGD
ncbi:unnamed protein product [Caretta caretta]